MEKGRLLTHLTVFKFLSFQIKYVPFLQESREPKAPDVYTLLRVNNMIHTSVPVGFMNSSASINFVTVYFKLFSAVKLIYLVLQID